MKLCVTFGRFFNDNFGLMCSFGLALFVVQDMVSPDQGNLVGCPGKSICEILSGTKVILDMVMLTEFTIRGRFRGSNDLFWAQERVLTHSVESSHGSKNLLQRAILYRHKEILLGRKSSRSKGEKTIYGKWSVFH